MADYTPHPSPLPQGERENRKALVEQGQWVSILSVPLRRIRPHFWTFSIAVTLHLAFNTYAAVTVTPSLPWRELPTAIIAETLPATVFWLVYSPILVEGVFMVFAEIYRQEKIEEGRKEGRNESNAAWKDWNRRRLEAEGRGESFDEPPPDFSNGSSGSSR